MGLRAKDAVPSILPLLEDDAPEVRTISVWTLGQMGDEGRKSIPALKKALEDEDPRVAQAAMESLETLDVVLDNFARNDVDSLPVAVSPTDSAHVDALITRQAAMRRYQEELDLQSR